MNYELFFLALFIESNWMCAAIFVVGCVQTAQPVKHLLCFCSATIQWFEWPIKFRRWRYGLDPMKNDLWFRWLTRKWFLALSVFLISFELFFDFRLDKMTVLIVAIKRIGFCFKKKKDWNKFEIYILKVIYALKAQI